MKKSFVWAMAATLIAGSAFAQSSLNATRFAIAPNATFATGSPATTNNDNSCDITTSPAATLLLPHFEVDIRSGVSANDAVNTLFTITNTSPVPQIAHVTVWTDWSFPVIDFNIFLTGYDVQGINLLDLIGRGNIPPTSNTPVDNVGARSFENDENPNFLASAATSCNGLPGPIPPGLLADVQTALTTGRYSSCTRLVGGTHTTAQGYITVDVAATCSQTLPTTASYYNSEILYDNVLIGDYQRINPSVTTGNYAGGNPLVHIKALPEGGPTGVGSVAAGSNLPYTFYDRYTPATDRRADRRQPLPSRFAARFISQGTQGFNTRYAIWREGVTNGPTSETCAAGIANNGTLPVTEVVRFDEQENPTTINPGCRISPCTVTIGTLPESSITSVDTASVFPPDFSGTNDAGGWMYLNLHNGGSSVYSATGPSGAGYAATASAGNPSGRASQNWVIVQMTAESRYGVDFDAAYLGNGCTPPLGATTVATGTGTDIGPAGGVCLSNTAPCTTINQNP